MHFQFRGQRFYISRGPLREVATRIAQTQRITVSDYLAFGVTERRIDSPFRLTTSVSWLLSHRGIAREH
jgi:hypothetical protein